MNQEVAEKTFATTIQHLAVRWQEAKVLLPLFPLLAEDGPLEIEHAAEVTGIPAARIEHAAAVGRCERDAKGRLVDLYGMTLSPTAHRIEVDSRIVFSCCALWAHVIPKLIGQQVEVESVDPVRRELVRLSISPGSVGTVEPASAAATMVVAGEDEIGEDVSAAFCSRVRHFVSRESAEEFARRSDSCRVVDLSHFQDEADHLYRAIWSVVHS
jgi:hypothetical protein